MMHLFSITSQFSLFYFPSGRFRPTLTACSYTLQKLILLLVVVVLAADLPKAQNKIICNLSEQYKTTFNASVPLNVATFFYYKEKTLYVIKSILFYQLSFKQAYGNGKNKGPGTRKICTASIGLFSLQPWLGPWNKSMGLFEFTESAPNK